VVLSGDLTDLENLLGLRLADPGLLSVALTHRSLVNEWPDAGIEDNERLEFLGDAVLGAVVATSLFRRFPEVDEGALTNMRAQLVCAAGLARWARRWDLGRWIVLGRGEEQRGGRNRESLLAGCFEAVIGAAYLDQGLDVVRALVEPLVEAEQRMLSGSSRSPDAKSELQRVVQAAFGGALPVYRVVRMEGPEHQPTFTIEVMVAEAPVARGTGPSKQAAEQEAAREALGVIADRLAGADAVGEPEH
jgi:ribonuclease-3